MVDDVPHSEHASVTVSNYDRLPETAPRHPLRRDCVIFDRFARELKSAAFGDATVTRAEDVMAASIERQHGEAKACQRRRQKACGADIEIHGVAVEVENSAGVR